MIRRLRPALRRLAGAFLALSLVAVSPAAAQLLHELAEDAGIAYLHAHGGLVHSHPHKDGHHSADGFASRLIPAFEQGAPAPVAPACAAPAAAPSLEPPVLAAGWRRAPAAARPSEAKRAPPGARGPPEASAVLDATLA